LRLSTPHIDLVLWPSLACGYVFLFHTPNRALEHEKVINKAGGLIYQRDFASSFACSAFSVLYTQSEF